MVARLKNNWVAWVFVVAFAAAFWAVVTLSAGGPARTSIANAPLVAEIVHDHSGDSGGQAVDLTQWDFGRQGGVDLGEGWAVFRDELVEPTQFLGTGCQISVENSHYHPVSLPDPWGLAFTTDITTGHGVATYCLEMVTGKTDQSLALRLGPLRSVTSVYAVFEDPDVGRERITRLFHNGDPVLSPHKDSGNPSTSVMVLPLSGGRLKIIVHLANYVHKQGGILGVPVVDYHEHLRSRFRRDGALPTALVLVLLLTSVATFVVGRFHDDKMRYNIFALLSAASALRVLFVSDIVWDYFPSFSLARKYDLEYVSLFLVLPAYYAFIQMLFRGGKIRPFDTFVYGLTGILTVFALFAAPFFPPGTITLVREPFQILWATIAVVGGYTIVKALVVDRGQKLDAALVLIAAMTMSGYEVLSGLGVISSSMEWSQILVLFVTLLHVRAFQLNFREVEQDRDRLNTNLVEMNKSLQKQAIDLKLALVQVEDSSQAKDEFLATMSHELRTPLNAIIGFSEVMQMQMFGPLGDERYKIYVDDILGSGKHLLTIVNDILDLTLIENGNDEMYEENIDLEVLAVSVVRLVSAQALERDVICRIDCIGTLPALYGDERKVRQILINLMSNAVKFNVPGGRVDLRLLYEAERLSLIVTDTGIGMSAEEIPIALARFRQVDGDLSRKYEGLGLGLSLVQVLSEQHGAKLEIVSEPNVGTTATVTFPAERTQLLEKRAI